MTAIACVMEQTLGHRTHYLNLRRHEAVVTGCEPHWLPIEYRDGRLPWTVTGSLAARRALEPLLPEIDGIFMHTTTLAPLTVDYFRRRPAILSADGTPLNKRAMRHAYGMSSERYGAGQAKRLVYREVFARARGFVAWSNWVKQSFVEDYGCREEDVAIISPGVDLEQFVAAERHNERPRILFVGGDFVRKGGDLLLEVFRGRLKHKAELVLVTRAPVAEEPGVRVYRTLAPNSQTLLELYRGADIFALPTRADCYSIGCMEALASGLPIVATPVGGIPDIVRDGETGHLLAVDDAQALGDTLEALIAEPARRREMGRRSRQDAVDRFDARESARRLFEFVCARC
jgi:glycosyltransferase involved in cell wall biosynthesis